MITANAARQISNSKTTAAKQEVEETLSAAIRAACELGERKVNLYKPPSLLKLAIEIAESHGYKTYIVTAVDQRDRDYLVVEW